jgi:hypothetical protein
MGDDLAAFVTARLDEDEAIAKAALDNALGIEGELAQQAGPCVGETGYAHIARHDPARVLRQVEAVRALLAAYQPSGQGVAYTLEAGLEFALGHLAAAWSDHPEYRAEWKH